MLGALEVLPFEAPADAAYGFLRTRLKETRRLIGANDLLIAAHARSLGLTLITNNTREFRRVRNLFIDNWTINS